MFSKLVAVIAFKEFMEIEKIINSELNNDKSTGIVDNTTQDLEILVTEADKYGTDITEMSNFFDIGIQRLSYELTKNAANEIWNEINADLEKYYAVINDDRVEALQKLNMKSDNDTLIRNIMSFIELIKKVKS